VKSVCHLLLVLDHQYPHYLEFRTNPQDVPPVPRGPPLRRLWPVATSPVAGSR
jgi:hypothetical protein